MKIKSFDIPMKSDIKTISLPRILSFLNRNRKTGTLILKTPVFTKKVYLVKGDAIFASSTYEDDRLGEMLIKAGKITMEQYDESVRMLKKTGKRQGAILVELGYLKPKDLFWGVKFQVKEIIYSLFVLQDAEYEFIEGEIPAHEVITLKMSMGNLIYDGVKRIDNWTRIRNEMPGADTVLKLGTDPVSLFQEIEISPQDRKMLSLIDGKMTIKELIDSSWIGSFEGMKTLYVLWSIGVVEETIKPDEKIEMEEETVSLDDILQPVSEDEQAFLNKVDDMFSMLGRLNPFELLEVNEKYNDDILKKNYYRLTREFHPDRYFSSPDPSVKDKLTAIFDALTNAYTSLTEKAKKKTVAQAVKEHKAKVPDKESAELHFKSGVAEFKKSNFSGAVQSFQSAIAIEPKNAKYWSYLSLSLTKLPGKLNDAETALSEAIKLDPKNSDHYANLGFIYIMKGKKKVAHDQLQRALKLNPKNIKAKKGLEKIK